MLSISKALSTLSLSSFTRSMATQAGHVKHKIPQKRASKLIGELRNEEYFRLKGEKDYSHIRTGDAVEVRELEYITASTEDVFKGLVIKQSRCGADSRMWILNVEYGLPILRVIPIFSPLVKDIQVLQKAFIHQGKKRVRRANISYILDRHPKFYTVDEKSLEDCKK